jgi:uncharacterized membrane-anchored protein
MRRRNAILLAGFVVVMFGCAFPLFSNSQEKPNPIEWQDGPAIGKLGSVAQISIPSGYKFTGKDGTKRVMEITQNPASGHELGALIPATKDQEWFVIFEFEDTGYVRDNEKDKLDAAAMINTITKATEESNKVRAENGWPAFHVVGWSREPYYDSQTHNLTWAIVGKSQPPGKPEEQSVNYSVRMLGRQGVMRADLVLSPAETTQVLPEFQNLLTGFSFVPGQTYADWRKGDKVAEYGLTALVVGGAAAAALKSGLLLKFWKLIVAAFVALAAFIKRVFAYLKRLFTGRASEETPQHG